MNKIREDEFMNIKGVSNIKYSKDGKTLAFTLGVINKEEDKYESYIYIKKENNPPFKLTSFGKEFSFFFLDNENIVFSSNRNIKEGESGTKYYKININGGEASEFIKFDLNVTFIKALKNGDFIVSALNNPFFENNELLNNSEKMKEYQKYQKDNQDYEEFKEVPFYQNESGFTKGMKVCLYYYDFSLKKLTELTKIDKVVLDFILSEDEKTIFYLANDSKVFMDFNNTNVYAYDLDKKCEELLISHKEMSVGNIDTYKNGFYFFASHNETGINTDCDLYYYDYNNKKIDLKSNYGYSFYSTVGTDIRIGGGSNTRVLENGDYYFISTRFDSANIYKYDGLKIDKVTDIEGSIDSFDIGDDRIAFSGLLNMMPLEVYELKNEKIEKITSFNDYLKDYFVAKPEKVEFKSVNDIIHGFILKPFEYDENKKYPLILDIHGGPKTVYGSVFYHEMQYWASEGYFVVYCNPTGSDGRGRSFADMRGRYGTVDYEDIMNFLNIVLEKYKNNIDKSHLYETGGSYGGFMTNWIIGHTNIFRACVSQRSISNWISFYGTSDIGVRFALDQTGASSINDIDTLWDKSPLKYAKNVKTPTLFIHSNEDYRCPIEQGMQMYTALIVNGVDSKLVYFKGENHELSRSGKPSHRLKRLNEITNWFKNHK